MQEIKELLTLLVVILFVTWAVTSIPMTAGGADEYVKPGHGTCALPPHHAEFFMPGFRLGCWLAARPGDK